MSIILTLLARHCRVTASHLTWRRVSRPDRRNCLLPWVMFMVRLLNTLRASPFLFLRRRAVSTLYFLVQRSRLLRRLNSPTDVLLTSFVALVVRPLTLLNLRSGITKILCVLLMLTVRRRRLTCRSRAGLTLWLMVLLATLVPLAVTMKTCIRRRVSLTLRRLTCFLIRKRRTPFARRMR